MISVSSSEACKLDSFFEQQPNNIFMSYKVMTTTNSKGMIQNVDVLARNEEELFNKEERPEEDEKAGSLQDEEFFSSDEPTRSNSHPGNNIRSDSSDFDFQEDHCNDLRSCRGEDSNPETPLLVETSRRMKKNEIESYKSEDNCILNLRVTSATGNDADLINRAATNENVADDEHYVVKLPEQEPQKNVLPVLSSKRHSLPSEQNIENSGLKLILQRKRRSHSDLPDNTAEACHNFEPQSSSRKNNSFSFKDIPTASDYNIFDNFELDQQNSHYCHHADNKNEYGLPLGEMGRNQESNGGKKSNTKDLQASSSTTESMDTETRLALEFPRHNWLAKHIMKDKSLKEEAYVNGHSSFAEKDKTATLPSTSECSSEFPTTSSYGSAKAVEALSNQHNMIGIVKPVQYFKENTPQKRKRSCSSDEGNRYKMEKRSRDSSSMTSKEWEAQKGANGDVDVCKSAAIDDVIANRNCTVIVAPASGELGFALDLTTKCKPKDDCLALDLSKKCDDQLNGRSVEKAVLSEDPAQMQKDTLKREDSTLLKCKGKDRNSCSSPLPTSCSGPRPFVVISQVPSLNVNSSSKTVKSNGSILFDVPEDGREKIQSISLKQSSLPGSSGPFQKQLPSPVLSSVGKALTCSTTTNNLTMQPANGKSGFVPRSAEKTVSSSNFPTDHCFSPKRRLSLMDLGKTKLSSEQPSENNRKLSFNTMSRASPVIDLDALEDDIPIIRPRLSSHPPIRHSTISYTNATSSTLQNKTNVKIPQPALHSNCHVPKSIPVCERRSYPELGVAPSSKQVSPGGKQALHIEKLEMEMKHNLLKHSSANSYGVQAQNFSKPFYQPSDFHTVRPESNLRHGSIITPQVHKNSLALEYSKRIASEQIMYAGKRMESNDTLRKKHMSSQHTSIVSSQPVIRCSSSCLSVPGMPASTILRPPAIHTQALYNKRPSLPLNNHSSMYPMKPVAIRNMSTPLNALEAISYNTTQRRTAQKALIKENLDYINQNRVNQDNRKHLPNLHLFQSHPSSVLPPNMRMQYPNSKFNGVPLLRPKAPIARHMHSQESLKPLTELSHHSKAPNLNMFSPHEAEKFASQLQVHKLELENRIHNLKVLEQKFYSAPNYNAQAHHAALQNLQHEQPLFVKSLQNVEKQRVGNNAGQLYEAAGKLPRTINPHSIQKDRTGRLVNQERQANLYPEKEGNGSLEEKCIFCKSKAFFVCSGCRSVWYCSKHCQLDDWPHHSKRCS